MVEAFIFIGIIFLYLKVRLAKERRQAAAIPVEMAWVVTLTKKRTVLVVAPTEGEMALTLMQQHYQTKEILAVSGPSPIRDYPNAQVLRMRSKPFSGAGGIPPHPPGDRR